MPEPVPPREFTHYPLYIPEGLHYRLQTMAQARGVTLYRFALALLQQVVDDDEAARLGHPPPS